MIGTYDLFMQFVSSNTPGGGTTPETGDFSWLLLLVGLLAIAIVAFGLRFLLDAKSQGTSVSAAAKNFGEAKLSRGKIALVCALLVAVFAVLGCTSIVKVFASPVADASNTVKVYVDETTGQVKSIDAGTYTNQTGQDIAIVDIASQITEEASAVSGLENAIMTVKSGNSVIYQANVGTPYTPENYTAVKNGETITLDFAFKDLNATVAQSLIGKTAIQLSFDEYTYNTITYDANEATSGTVPAPTIKPTDKTVYVAYNTGGLAKGAYEFTGWDTSAAGDGTHFDEGATYTENANMTLYAQFMFDAVTITYQIVEEYKELNHGSVQLNASSNSDWTVTEAFDPAVGPKGAEAIPSTEADAADEDLGPWEFSHWSILSAEGEEICVSEKANFVPTKQALGLDEWQNITITAHFGKAIALYSPNEKTLTFKFTEDESILSDTWAMPVYRDTKIDLNDINNNKYPSWCASDGTLLCYPETATFEKDFYHFKGIESMDLWFASNYTIDTLYNLPIDSSLKEKTLHSITGLENIDTSQLKTTVATFADKCKNLVIDPEETANNTILSVDISSWDTSQLVDTSYMFADCKGIADIKFPNDFGEKIENTQGMFENCASLKKLDLPETNKFLLSCTNCADMFSGCSLLESVDLSNLKVTDEMSEAIDDALHGCNNVIKIIVGPKWESSSLHLTDMGLFEDGGEEELWYASDESDEALSSNEIPQAPLSDKVTYRQRTAKAVYRPGNESSLTFYYDNIVYNEVTFGINDYLNAHGRREDNFDKRPIFPEWYSYTATANGKNLSSSKIIDNNYRTIPGLKINIQLKIDAENVIFDKSFKDCPDLTSMSYFFMADSNGKQSFKTFKGWEYVNCEHLKDLTCMFGGFVYRSMVDKTELNTNLENFPEINSYECDTYGTSITSLDLTKLDIFGVGSANAQGGSGGLNFRYIFANSLNLKEVKMPVVPQTHVNKGGLPSIIFNNAFENCISLNTFPNLNGYKIDNAKYMFWNCTSLTEMDLSNFDTSYLVGYDHRYMFLGCNNLNKITINNNWDKPLDDCCLIETWPQDTLASDYNPWMKEGTAYHVSQIGKDSNYGTFTRGNNTIGMQEIQISSDDTSKGTIEPASIYFVDYEVQYDEFNATTLLLLPGGVIKIGNTFVQAKPADGYEFSYWVFNGKIIPTSQIEDELFVADPEGPNELVAHFRLANYRAKAVYNSTAETLTMYYDDKNHSGEGEVFEINNNTYIKPSNNGESGGGGTAAKIANGDATNVIYKAKWDNVKFDVSIPSWFEFSQDNENNRFAINSKVDAKEVVFDSSFAEYTDLQSISMWFMADSDNDQTFENFKSVDAQGNELAPFANLNTANLRNVEYAFGGLYLNRYFLNSGGGHEAANEFSSENAPFGGNEGVIYNSSYNTYGNSFNKLDLSGFDFSNLTNMDWMFSNCQSVEGIKFGSDVNTQNVTSMNGVFNNCESCTGIEGLRNAGFKTNNVTKMDNLFQGCSHLTKLDLSNFDTQNVEKQPIYLPMQLALNGRNPYVHNNMFMDCVRLSEINITSTFDEAQRKWSGWTLYMDICDLPVNGNDAQNVWKYSGDSTMYAPVQIPLNNVELDEPTSASQVLSGTFTRQIGDIHTVNITSSNLEQGQISYLGIQMPEWNYYYVASVNISANQNASPYAPSEDQQFSNSHESEVLYIDDRTYYAVPAQNYVFKNWVVSWTDEDGKQVKKTLNDQNSIYFNDYKPNVTVTANFAEVGYGATALLSKDANGKGYFSFKYDKHNYVPDENIDITLNGTTIASTTVVKAYNVNAKHSDYDFPEWYAAGSFVTWLEQNPHYYVPVFDSEFDEFSIDDENSNPLTIVFEDSFKSFDTLQSLSCFFMQALQESNRYASLVRPFLFDSEHFKGLNNICMDSVWNVQYMFGGHEYFNDINGSRGFEEIDLTGLDMRQLNNLDAMFANCLNLNNITWPTGFDGKNITSMYKTFFNCDKLYDQYLCDALDGIDVSNVQNMSYMFAKYHNGTSEELNAENDSIEDEVIYKFPSEFNPASCSDMTRMFAGNIDPRNITLKTDVTFLDAIFGAKNEAIKADATGMFEGCTNLWNINSSESVWLNNLDVVKAVNMFARCYLLQGETINKLGSAGYPKFTSCIDMYGMFYDCTQLYNFKPSNFDTSNVLYMDNMFAFSSLQNFVVDGNLGPQSFDTSSVVDFSGMFSNCSEIQKVDLKRENLTSTKLIVDAEKMFFNCSRVTDLTLKNIVFDSDENYNKDRSVSRNLTWDKDISNSASASISDGTHHPYSDMFSGISTTGSIQLFEIDDNWNGKLGEPKSLSPTDPNVDPWEIDRDCGFPSTYWIFNPNWEKIYFPLLWKLDSTKYPHIIGEAGEITKKQEDGSIVLPFGAGKFVRNYDTSEPSDPANLYMNLDTSNDSYEVTLREPSLSLPDGYSPKYIDLKNCTKLQYKFEKTDSPLPQIEDYNILFEATYTDAAVYTFCIKGSTSHGPMGKTDKYISKYYMGNSHSDIDPIELTCDTESWTEYDLASLKGDETYLLSLSYNLVQKPTNSDDVDNNSANNQDADASADEASQGEDQEFVEGADDASDFETESNEGTENDFFGALTNLLNEASETVSSVLLFCNI